MLTPPLTVVITGDRSMPAAMALPIVQQLLLQLAMTSGGALRVLTGGLKGVEEAVRYACASTTIEVVNLEFLTKDWQAYGELLKSQSPHKVYFLHSDPAVSNLYQGVAPAFDDSTFELVQPELLFAPA